MPNCADLLALDCAERAASHAAAVLHRELSRGTASLKAVACLAPMLGAFATALGLMQGLAVLRTEARCGICDINGGPENALVLLVLSLPVAMFAFGGFHYMSRRIETFGFEMRVARQDLLNSLALMCRKRR